MFNEDYPFSPPNVKLLNARKSELVQDQNLIRLSGLVNLRYLTKEAWSPVLK